MNPIQIFVGAVIATALLGAGLGVFVGAFVLAYRWVVSLG